MRTRAAEADLLRPHVRELVDRTSFRAAADDIGVSVGAIRNLLSGRTPQADVLVRFHAWAERAGVGEGKGGGEAEVSADALGGGERRRLRAILEAARDQPEKAPALIDAALALLAD